MSDKSVSTKIDSLIETIKAAEKDPKKFNKLIKSIESTIPVRTGRKQMPKADKYLNHTFLIKRINYNAIAKVIKKDDTMYNVEVISVEFEGDKAPKIQAGDTLFISKRELEMTARPYKT